MGPLSTTPNMCTTWVTKSMSTIANTWKGRGWEGAHAFVVAKSLLMLVVVPNSHASVEHV